MSAGSLTVQGVEDYPTDLRELQAACEAGDGEACELFTFEEEARKVLLKEQRRARRVWTLQLSDAYQKATSEHYIACAIVQSTVLVSGADVVCQRMHGEMDYAHVAAMATVASCFSGAFNSTCLRSLERLMPGPSASAITAKTILHFCLPAALINSVYLGGVPLLTAFYGQDFSDGLAADLVPLLASGAVGGWSPDAFRELMLVELVMFAPYNLLAFRMIPQRIRPLTAAALGATFSIVVSAATLQY